MDQEHGAKPLDSFPILRSRSIEEIREALVRSYSARRFDFPNRAERIELRANQWQSRNIALSHLSGMAFQLEFPSADFFRQAFIRGGAAIRIGRSEKQVASAASCVIPPEALVTSTFASGFEHFGLRIKSDALVSKLTALMGATPSRGLEFDRTSSGDVAAAGHLYRMMMFFAAEVDSSTPGIEVAELEQALIVSFLSNNRHNYSAFLEDRARPIASWQVRRVEEYIEAHWDQPLTIEDLARATSASARSIFHQFKRSRGRTPMAFLKDVRLRHARLMLQRAGTEPSVTETAMACGFGNLGHFARDYFTRFGERPSDTLKRR